MPPLKIRNMSCELTSGYSWDCMDRNGGITEVYIYKVNDLDSYTISDGQVTDITLKSGKRAWKFELSDDASNFVQTPSSDRAAGTSWSDQVLTMVLNDNKKATRNLVATLVKMRFCAVVKQVAGDEYKLLGANRGLNVTTAENASGTTINERNGYTITANGQEVVPAYDVDPTIVAGLLIPES